MQLVHFSRVYLNFTKDLSLSVSSVVHNCLSQTHHSFYSGATFRLSADVISPPFFKRNLCRLAISFLLFTHIIGFSIFPRDFSVEIKNLQNYTFEISKNSEFQ